MDSRLVERLESAIGELSKTVAELKNETPASAEDKSVSGGSSPRAEFLSVRELARQIPYREQTIRNLMSTGEFKQGVHYYKRRHKIVFVWSAVLLWLGEQTVGEEDNAPFYPVHHARSRKARETIL